MCGLAADGGEGLAPGGLGGSMAGLEGPPSSQLPGGDGQGSDTGKPAEGPKPEPSKT